VPRRRSERLYAERILALCREVEDAISAAAQHRVSTARALSALIEAQRRSTELCEEADRFLRSQNGLPKDRKKKTGGP
jgi:hypothetical protein